MPDLNLQNINEHLRVYVEEKRQVQRLRNQRQMLLLQIQHYEAVFAKQTASLKREGAAIDAWERKSLRWFFATLAGNREKRQEAEKQRFLYLRHRRDESYTLVTEARAEVGQIDQQLAHIGSVEDHYAELINLKEKLLLDHKTGPYVQHLEMLEDFRQDQKELHRTIAFCQKLNQLLTNMREQAVSMQAPYKYLQRRNNFLRERSLRSILGDWKTLHKGLVHLNRKLVGLQQEIGIKLPRKPGFYAKLFDHFVRKQLEVPAPTGFSRLIPGRTDRYWDERVELAALSLQTYQEEISALLKGLREQAKQLDRLLREAEQKRLQLLEEL
jgi:hypothetical protein